MPHFASTDELYADLGTSFKALAAHAERGAALRAVDTVVQYRLSSPDATITLAVREKEDAAVDLGETKRDAEVVLGMDADTGRALFYGELDLTRALADGTVRVKGPVGKALKLLKLVGPVPEGEEAPAAEGEAPAEGDAPAEGEAAPEGEATPTPDGEAPAEGGEPGEGTPAEEVPTSDGDAPAA